MNYQVRLQSHAQVREIRQWANENGVGFWWNGNGIDSYTIVADESTMVMIKLKFGDIDVK